MLKYNNIPQTIQKIEPQLDQRIVEVINHGINTARTFVGYDTGLLSSTIKMKTISKLHGQLSAGEGIPDERAAANNYGTAFQIGTFYMDKAAAEMQQLLDLINMDL